MRHDLRIKMRLIVVPLVFVCALFAQQADLVIIHAKIRTVNPAQPAAKVIAIRNGLILAVVGDASIRSHIGAHTQVIDAHGATILPGLIDAHGHMQALGESLENVDLRGMKSEREIAAKVQAETAKRKPGQWIRGEAWDQNLWPSKSFPTAALLSQAAPNNPVVLGRVDGHALWINRKAMEIAHLDRATRDPAGGRILRDASGAPTGVLLDRAMALIEARIPPPSPADTERYLLRAANECARLGLTTVHDAGVPQQTIDAYRSLIRKHQLPIRIYAMIQNSPDLIGAWLARGPEIGDYLTVRAIKLIADGALGSRGAALLSPYADDPANRGLLILDRAFIRSIAERAIPRDFQVNTHAIGDRANHETLLAYADALRGPNDKRFRIEHAQVVAPTDFALFRQYSIIASMQPTHATSDMPWAQARLGPGRIRGAYAWQTFLHLGVHIPAGSDFPVESPNPIRGLYAATTRENENGLPPGGWFPDQRMSREEALRSFTIEGAYAAFEERKKGSLVPGKLADLVMLSGDPMKVPQRQMLQLRVTMTIVGGRIVYREP
jgi:predicted amidohydrolase YtcJ